MDRLIYVEECERQKCQKLSLISHVDSLVYNFHRDKKEVKHRTLENCYKWRMQYTYPVPFSNNK